MMEIKSTSDIRAFLVTEMGKVARGEAKPDTGKAVANLAQQIYNTFLIEAKMAKIRATLGDEALKPVQLDAS